MLSWSRIRLVKCSSLPRLLCSHQTDRLRFERRLWIYTWTLESSITNGHSQWRSGVWSDETRWFDILGGNLIEREGQAAEASHHSHWDICWPRWTNNWRKMAERHRPRIRNIQIQVEFLGYTQIILEISRPLAARWLCLVLPWTSLG